MKRTIVSTLALCALAGSAFVASAATKTPDRGDHYDLNVVFTNPPVLTSVGGLPTGSKTIINAFSDEVIFTDGSGKIEGVTSMAITNPGGSATYGIYVADVTGSIGTSKTNTTIKMSIKGNGYAEAGTLTNQQSSSCALNFASGKTTGIVSNVQTFSFTTNVTLIFLNDNGTTNQFNSSETIDPTTSFSENAYSNVVITYHFSTNWSAGGTNFFDDQIMQASVPFGPPVLTNTFGTIQPPLGFGTNSAASNFTLVTVQAFAVPSGTNASVLVTNAEVDGINISDLAAFISGFNVSNASIVQVVSSVTTNLASSGGSSTAGVTLTNFLVSIPGTLTGTIKVGKTSTKVNEAANLVGSANWVVQGDEGEDGSGQLVLVSTNIELGFFLNVTNFVSVTNGVAVTNAVTTNSFAFTNFPTFFVKTTGTGLDLFTEETLPGEVVQLGKKMWLAVDEESFAFSGTGSLATKSGKKTGTNTTYTANLKGVGRAHGSSLKITGTNGVLITQYIVVSNAPTTVLNVTNIAANPPLVVTFTNAATNGFTVNASTVFIVNGVTYTNTLGNSQNVVFVNNTNVVDLSVGSIHVAPTIQTNLVPLAIKSVIKTGKIMGQSLPANSKKSVPVTGFNHDARFGFSNGVVPQSQFLFFPFVD